jgi:sulfonate transport system substrate-binding protein
MPPLTKPDAAERRPVLRVLAITAASWGLGGPVALVRTGSRPGASAPLGPLAQLRIGYQKTAANLVIVK